MPSLPPLKDFVLPGGTPGAAACHLARAVCRRAERRVITLQRDEPVNAEAVRYLNRLSDLLFVMSRVLCRVDGGTEVIWKPRPGRRSADRRDRVHRSRRSALLPGVVQSAQSCVMPCSNRGPGTLIRSGSSTWTAARATAGKPPQDRQHRAACRTPGCRARGCSRWPRSRPAPRPSRTPR